MSAGRDLAYAAFADLDAIDRRCLSNFTRDPADVDRKERALQRLAWAMDREFGPLPAPPVVVVVPAWRAPDDEFADLQDDIGDELADREDRP